MLMQLWNIGGAIFRLIRMQVPKGRVPAVQALILAFF
jgi:hypothetical protein